VSQRNDVKLRELLYERFWHTVGRRFIAKSPSGAFRQLIVTATPNHALNWTRRDGASGSATGVAAGRLA